MSTSTLTLRGLALRRESDEAVLSHALDGDEVAFAEIYRRYSSRVYAYCLARLMDPQDAADAAQQVFMRVLRARPEQIENAAPWLYTIARHVVIDIARAKDRLPQTADLAGDEADRLPSAGDTADALLRREDARSVFLALRRLRPRYRTALILREIHGMTSAEIGEALDLRPGAVDTLVCRARDAFAVAYAEAGAFPSGCRSSVESLYRKTGTGIGPAEQAALDRHLKSCARCRAEAKKAAKPSHLAGLLPLFTPEILGRLGPLAAAMQTAVSSPAVMHATPGVAGTIATLVVASALVLAPIALSGSARSTESLTDRPAVPIGTQAAQPLHRPEVMGPVRPLAPTTGVAAGAHSAPGSATAPGAGAGPGAVGAGAVAPAKRTGTVSAPRAPSPPASPSPSGGGSGSGQANPAASAGAGGATQPGGGPSH